ncbi:hypothetical protein Daura_21790 [Dactylosporangium aurantiacum]|uniref:Uncharacterized protein n=1 Tax=Dactylosporangium aurantiacum TaxID=35754 RepID=A0A9Q9MMV6_9ACTN|nr:hypothetical protein [Dactylosporangium aurantiacum]MDG6110309.1 hypothetical protein [Dactylosporangium aurantiacum]UWZ58571.1 hypothetical protein Daura_21790 [Dactylosporangium aurantiacum]
MVLTGLARWAGKRPHVLFAVAPGATRTRLAAEAQLTRIGGVVAESPADADVLLVVGSPGSELAGAIDEVWRQMPGPLARLQVAEPQEAADALRRAMSDLSADIGHKDRVDEWADAGSEQHDGHDQQSVEDGSEEHDDAGASGEHGEHGEHGDAMQMPGGLMMADREADRDGLKLDVLRVPWGPVLPDWPAGLVVDLLMQGDLVQRVDARVLPAAAEASTLYWSDADADGRRVAASHLDSLGRLLATAGWPAMACRVRQLRDAVLTCAPADRLRGELARVDRRLRRSVGLRWATDGLGVLTADAAERLDVDGPACRAVGDGGDVSARWRRWLSDADRLLAGEAVHESGPRGDSRGDRPASAALLTAAEELMAGLDVAAARLVLASFDPDPDELVQMPEPAGAGP